MLKLLTSAQKDSFMIYFLKILKIRVLKRFTVLDKDNLKKKAVQLNQM